MFSGACYHRPWWSPRELQWNDFWWVWATPRKDGSFENHDNQSSCRSILWLQENKMSSEKVQIFIKLSWVSINRWQVGSFLEHPSQCRDIIIVKSYWTSLVLMSLTFYIVRTPLLFSVSANFIGISLLIPYSCFQQDVIILCLIKKVIQREHYTYYNYV